MSQKSNTGIKHNPFWSVGYSHVIIFFLCFLTITLMAVTGLVKNIDVPVSNYFENINRNGQSDLLVIAITTVSDTINLIIAGFILTIIKKTRRFGMIILISLVASTILVTYVKPLVAIDQPPSTFKPMVILPEKFSLEKDSFMPFAQNYSYPSNHLASTTAFSFIVGGMIYNRLPYFAKGFMMFFPTTIGITKLYLLQQYFSDLIGGCILGLIISSLIVKLLKTESKGQKGDLE
jgi:undecaprenyl-diphosphatase